MHRRLPQTQKEFKQWTRDEITRRFNPIEFLGAVMNGEPVAELDWEGHVIKYARPTMDHRVTAAKELLARVAPTLKAVDVNAAGDGTVSFTFVSQVELPNSETRENVIQLSLPPAPTASLTQVDEE